MAALFDATTDEDIISESKREKGTNNAANAELAPQSLVTANNAAVPLKTMHWLTRNGARECFMRIKQFTRRRYVFQRMLFQKIKAKVKNRLKKIIM